MLTLPKKTPSCLQQEHPECGRESSLKNKTKARLSLCNLSQSCLLFSCCFLIYITNWAAEIITVKFDVQWFFWLPLSALVLKRPCTSVILFAPTESPATSLNTHFKAEEQHAGCQCPASVTTFWGNHSTEERMGTFSDCWKTFSCICFSVIKFPCTST